MNVLAVDTATTFGYAHTNGKSGSVSLWSRRGESPGICFLMFRAWLVEFLDANPTDLIVYEQAGRQLSNASTHATHGYISTLETVAAERTIELTNRSPTEVKKHACPEISTRKANKTRMIQAAENRWPDVVFVDDNHADACHLLSLVVFDLKLGELVLRGS